jgi:hypothetical protein
MINMIQNFNFVGKEELLTVEEWQHVEDNCEAKEAVQRENKEEEKSKCAPPSSSEIICRTLTKITSR